MGLWFGSLLWAVGGIRFEPNSRTLLLVVVVRAVLIRRDVVIGVWLFDQKQKPLVFARVVVLSFFEGWS